MSIEDFREKYGAKGKDRERYQRAIRAEMAGGDLLLDLLLLVHQMRRRARGEEAERLLVVEDRLQRIRDAMVLEIRRRYGIVPKSPGPPGVD